LTAHTQSFTIRAEFFGGIRGELPILLGVIPFGMIYGILALQAGLSTGEAQAMSAVVFAGSSQFILTRLVETGAPGLILVLTVAIVNLRHALYSASVAPYLQKLSPLWKWILGYLLTDEAYAVSIVHYMKESPSPYKHYYFLGAGLTLWSGWQLSTAAGIFLGAQIPGSWPLDFTLALTFIALVVPALKDKAAVLAALAAGVTAVLAYPLPYKLGLVAAALAGILAGVGWEYASARLSPASPLPEVSPSPADPRIEPSPESPPPIHPEAK
jgi:4-azaleucine resistance transporter AzlC